ISPRHFVSKPHCVSHPHGELETSFEEDRHCTQPMARVVHEFKVVAVFVGVHRHRLANDYFPDRV
ncbi:MAG: hypothetical protein OEQ39_24855, partial [Gammaproteobacteria bacterium]|nr:hypothetical protein [Gammaproteobacteria bacterium]